jgi:predicted DCC family thiol-disulfide oxidoreductase YuxK
MTSPRPDLAMQPAPRTPSPVVLFDGVCNLCNGWVNFLIDRDPQGVLRFASLQSSAAGDLLRSAGHAQPAAEPETILFVDGGRVFERSAAVLRMVRYLSGGWWLLGALAVVPRPVRDLVYRWIARHRYAWFGKSETCRVPTPELRARFLG